MNQLAVVNLSVLIVNLILIISNSDSCRCNTCVSCRVDMVMCISLLEKCWRGMSANETEREMERDRVNEEMRDV